MKLPCLLAFLAVGAGLNAQQGELTLRGGTEEVLLDFVVRDKHQKLVEDLKLEDLQIFEDGVRQTPRSFVFRSGRTPVASPVSEASNGLIQSISDPLRQINLVTLVFEAMSPLSRRTAVERAHEFLKAEAGPNTWMAVYSLRYQLSVQQTYTTDIALLHKAVDRAGTGAYEEFAKENLNIVQRMNSLQAGGWYAEQFQPLSLGSAQERGPQNDSALAKAEIQMQQLILKTLFRQEGVRSIDALRRLVREQAHLPGRKTILFFSEGLVIPPDQPEMLDSVIAEANRGNVTFYTVDARGLGSVSNNRVARDTAQSIQAAEQSISGMGPGGQQEQASGQAMTPSSQSAEAIYQTDLQSNARHLAEGTGGFAMDNSNDLRGPLERVMEDIRSHYEVTYASTSKNFDGHFRKLEVKLDRPGLKVQSRAGYYALPLVGGETIEPYELAALNAMNMDPPPRSFPYKASALRFGEDCRVVFAIPASSLKFTNDAAKNTFQMRVSVLGVVKDEQGQIVAKIGKDLPFSGPLEKQASFAEGKVTLTLPLHLAPGRYQLQTAVIDREADRASVKRSVLIIPEHSAVSDVVWVRSVEAGQTPEPGNVLDTPHGRITPELEPTLTQKDSAFFYFIAFAAPSAKEEPQAQITVARDGKALATLPLAKPQRDEGGEYRYSGTLPLDQLEPGQYQLIASVTQNGARNASQAVFEVR